MVYLTIVTWGPKSCGAHLATYRTSGVAATTSSVSQAIGLPLTTVWGTMAVIEATHAPVQLAALAISEMPAPSARYSELVGEPSEALAKARPAAPRPSVVEAMNCAAEVAPAGLVIRRIRPLRMKPTYRLPSGPSAVAVGLVPATIADEPSATGEPTVSLSGLNFRRMTAVPWVELSGT